MVELNKIIQDEFDIACRFTIEDFDDYTELCKVFIDYTKLPFREPVANYLQKKLGLGYIVQVIVEDK